MKGKKIRNLVPILLTLMDEKFPKTLTVIAY